MTPLDWHRVAMRRWSAAARALAVGFILAIAIGVACSDGDGEDRSTGIPEVDAVIAAVESHDPAELRALVQFQTLGCTHDFGEGGPPKCDDDEPEGTEVEVFEFHSCAFDWRREAASDFNTGVDTALADTAANEPLVYAVFRPAPGFLLPGYSVPSEYILVFEGPDARFDGEYPRGVYVSVEDGAVTAILLSCGAGDPVDGHIPAEQTEFLLDPPEPE